MSGAVSFSSYSVNGVGVTSLNGLVCGTVESTNTSFEPFEVVHSSPGTFSGDLFSTFLIVRLSEVRFFLADFCLVVDLTEGFFCSGLASSWNVLV